MANALLQDLSAAAALSGSDLFYVKQGGARGLKATGTQLLALVGTAYVPLAGGTMTGALTLPAGAVGAPSLMFTGAGATTGIFSPGADRIGVAVAGVTKLDIADSGVNVTTNLIVFNNNAALYFGSAYDIALFRDAAGTLAQRNGTTQQIFRLYNSYTDSSNFERLTLTGVAGTSVNITAETLGTGGDNLDIVLTPAGTGSVKFPAGTYVTSTGYFITSGVTAGGNSSVNYHAVGFRTRANGEVAWTSEYLADAVDTALMRNAAGVVEINNGTAGTFRDLKLRNLLSTGYAQIDSGTLTASAPALNITQTFNNAAVAFDADTTSVTNTASMASSTLKKWVVGGTTVASVYPSGLIKSEVSSIQGYNVEVHNTAGAFGWAGGSLTLLRDAAGSLALRNGTAQQSFSVYNTYTDSSNYERLKLTGVAGTSVNITAETLGTGGDNLNLVLTPAGAGVNHLNAAVNWVNNNASIRNTDATGTGRLYLDVSNVVFRRGDGASSPGMWKFGGETSGSPGIKASGTTLQSRLADDSGYGSLESLNLGQTGYHQMTEMTAPSAPATNSVRIYAEDNGSGKTRLMALFATGAAQQIAIEP